jgi:hypothetical protein
MPLPDREQVVDVKLPQRIARRPTRTTSPTLQVTAACIAQGNRPLSSRTATIVKTSGSISDDAINAFIKVQEAIEVIDAAIDGLRYEQEDEEMDDE